VKAISDKYKLQRSVGTINRLDGVTSGASLSAENTKTIFSADLTKAQMHSFDDGQNLVLIRTTPATAAQIADKSNTDSNPEGLKNALARKMLDTILKQLESDTKVKINEKMIQL
jgi:hypothetical protein